MTDTPHPASAAPADPHTAPAGGARPVGAEAEGTRSALIRAGIDLFGRNGFDGTSTREIAKAAGVNIAGIAYHFGGKAGLHRACGEAIAAIIAANVGPFEPGAADVVLDPDAAVETVVAALCRMGRFMLGRAEAESVARFMVREQMDPSPTFALLYETLMRPRHVQLCRLFGLATGEDPESEAVVIAVSALIGQIMFFRVGRATALRRLGWETMDAGRVETILAEVAFSVRATVAARRAATRTAEGKRT